MDHSHLQQLLERYHNGTITPEQLTELEQWYTGLDKTREPFFQGNESSKEEHLQHLLQNIHQGIQPVAPVISLRKRWYRGVAAAAILLIIPAAAWLWYRQSAKPPAAAIAQTITIPTGEACKVWLPDSSAVWLSGGSSLQYNQDYGQATRDVQLQKGKGFFEVKKDPAHPFIVTAGNLQTKVLGTSFTVDIEKTEAPLVAVATGKVAVSLHQKELSVLLPGKQLQANAATGQFHISEQSAAFVNAWTKQELLLSAVSFDELSQAFQAFYGVQISTTNAGIRQNKYNILLQRHVEASKVLLVICKLYHNQYRPMPDGSYSID